MKNFLFILLLFFPIVIFAQRVKKDPGWETQTTSYTPNDIGEEYEVMVATRNENDSLQIDRYHTQLFADMRKIATWIKDSTLSDDLLSLRAPGAFAIDLRAGYFVYHDNSGTTTVHRDPNLIVRVSHERSGAIYYKYFWGECHDEENNYIPEMVVELVHLWGKTCIIATACGDHHFINACTDPKLSELWEVFTPVRGIK